MTDILTIKNGRKVVNNGMNEEKVLLDEINLTIREGDFITVLSLAGMVLEKAHCSIRSLVRFNSVKDRSLLKIS